MQLTHIFAPEPHESSLGYYRRLASSNALLHWKELARMAEVSPSRSGLLGEPDYMAQVVGLDPLWTTAAAEQEAMARQWRGLHRAMHDAVCPLCLQDSAHILGYWEHGYVVACVKHGVQLVDRCEACGELLATTRERIEQCACGHDLRTHTCTPATPAQLWLARLIAPQEMVAGAKGPSVDCGPPVQEVEVLTLSKLVRTLCLLADPAGAGPKRNTAPPKTVGEAIEFLRPLEQLLSDWPHGFEDHVKDRIAAGKAQARTLNALLGRWYLELKMVAGTGPLRPFIDVILRIGSENFNGVIGLDSAGAQSLAGVTHVLLTQAAASLGVGRDALLKAVQQKGFAHRTMRFGTRGITYEMPVEEVERIRQLRLAWISEDEACRLLGVPPGVLGQLSAAGLVTIDRRWRNDVCKAGPVESCSVNGLIERLQAHPCPAKTRGEDLIALSELTSRRMGDKAAIQAAMKAIAAGEILPAGKARRVGDLQYRLAEIRKHFGTPVLEAGLSINELSKLSGWKWESISHWIDEGLLECDEILLRGQPCRVVSTRQLLKFLLAYTPLSNVADGAGSRSSTLIDHLDAEIVGAKTLPSGAQRGGLVRISDLGRLSVLGSKVRGSYQETGQQATVAPYTRADDLPV